MTGGPPPRTLYTVSALTALLRVHIESAFSDIWVEGEVSNLRIPTSGHAYFTLKDASSQIRAVLFRSVGRSQRFALQDGLQLVCRGRLTVYEPRGDYQVIVEYAEPKGVGALQLAFEQLKARLAAEGLFDQARKRPLPFLPRRIGVVTSPTGAAIRDIVQVAHKRDPGITIVLDPVAVQGESAAGRSRTSGRSTRRSSPGPSRRRAFPSYRPWGTRSILRSPTSSPTCEPPRRRRPPNWWCETGPTSSSGSSAMGTVPCMPSGP